MLATGAQAPDFELESLDGQRYSLDGRPAVLVFCKTNCPTCQYVWPFYERLYLAFRQAGLRVWGISQHGRDKTAQYAAQYGSSFPMLLDTGLNVSSGYELEFVPTSFLIDANRIVLASYVSWNRDQFDELAKRITELLHVAFSPVIEPEEEVAPFRPG